MEAWGVWLVVIGVLIAGASAAFAWVQAHSAVESLKDAREARDQARVSAEESARLAGEANAAFVRQAEAQEEANRIKREEIAPKDWTLSQVSAQVWRVTNTSQGVLHVSSFKVTPDAAEKAVIVQSSHVDGRYEFADSFQFSSVRTINVAAEKLTVVYRRADDAPDARRRFHITL